MYRFFVVFFMLVSFAVGGCASTGKKTPEDKRRAVLNMKDEVLSELYRIKPDVKAQLSSASGYAVFTNASIQFFLLGGGGGYGVVRDNNSGSYTYMKMGEVAVGMGLGAKDFRIVFVFHNRESMNRFIEEGVSLGVQADAAAKASEKGAAYGGAATTDNVTIYQLTETGLALQATIKGTKFWKDDALNQ